MARTSNNRVIATCDLYCCLLPQCEALRTCRSGVPIAKLPSAATLSHQTALSIGSLWQDNAWKRATAIWMCSAVNNKNYFCCGCSQLNKHEPKGTAVNLHWTHCELQTFKRNRNTVNMYYIPIGVKSTAQIFGLFGDQKILWLSSRIWFIHRPVTRGDMGGFAPPGKMCWKFFKTIGHSSKKLAPSQKTLCPCWCPKLVTGLFIHESRNVTNSKLVWAVVFTARFAKRNRKTVSRREIAQTVTGCCRPTWQPRGRYTGERKQVNPARNCASRHKRSRNCWPTLGSHGNRSWQEIPRYLYRRCQLM